MKIMRVLDNKEDFIMKLKDTGDVYKRQLPALWISFILK